MFEPGEMIALKVEVRHNIIILWQCDYAGQIIFPIKELQLHPRTPVMLINKISTGVHGLFEKLVDIIVLAEGSLWKYGSMSEDQIPRTFALAKSKYV